MVLALISSGERIRTISTEYDLQKNTGSMRLHSFKAMGEDAVQTCVVGMMVIVRGGC